MKKEKHKLKKKKVKNDPQTEAYKISDLNFDDKAFHR